jgi:hypothetical protein
VLLADYRLPGRNGLELALDARRSRPRIGIAVMTSFAEEGTEREARANGADDFFEKPLHSSNFVTRITDLVTRSRASGSPAPEACEAPLMTAVAQDTPAGVATQLPKVAGSGSGERAMLRDVVFAPLDSAVAGNGGHTQPEGTDGLRRTRSSALPDPGSSHDSGCEGLCDAIPRKEVGLLDPHLLARALHPNLAFADVMAQFGPLRAFHPVTVWASGAPEVSIGSGVCRITAVDTRPDWSASD